jgi:CMP-N-acetylneuraminic acid synthetase
MHIQAFLPCRKGSERVPRKNIKPFMGFKKGLVEIKLRQLLGCDLIDEVVLSTNDDEILDFASSFKVSKLQIHQRKDSLCSSSTSTDELVSHALDLIPNEHILWTHVTSPFINSSVYSDIISRYKKCLVSGYDSLMTTTLIHAFLWGKNGPINYDRNIEKWPRTQTLEPLHEINSGAFLNSAFNYKVLHDRIGVNPFFYSMDRIIAHDIDWPDDFSIAESIAGNGLAEI